MSKRIKRQCAACGKKVTDKNVRSMAMKYPQNNGSFTCENVLFCSFKCLVGSFLILCFKKNKNNKEEFMDEVSDSLGVHWTQAAALYDAISKGKSFKIKRASV